MSKWSEMSRSIRPSKRWKDGLFTLSHSVCEKVTTMLWSSPFTTPFFVSAQKGAITLADKWDACAIASHCAAEVRSFEIHPPIAGVTAALRQTMEGRRWPCGDWIYPVGLRWIVKSWKPGVIGFPSRRQSAPRADPMGWSGREGGRSSLPFFPLLFSFESPKRARKCLGWRWGLDRAPLSPCFCSIRW